MYILCTLIALAGLGLVANAEDLLAISNICQLPGFVDGRYRHPTNCNQYILCINKVTYINNCGYGLVFNDLTKDCDNLVNVPRCYSQIITMAPSTTTTTKQPVVTYSYIPDYILNYCRDNNILDNSNHPHPENCNQFLKCSSSYTFIMTCAPGQAYSESLQKCVDESTVSRCLPGYSTFCADRSYTSGTYADPYDCSKYIQCPNGVTEHMPCPDGTLFNSVTLNCDFPYNVDCTKNRASK